jgi:outer membrane protein assembly factor BamB
LRALSRIHIGSLALLVLGCNADTPHDIPETQLTYVSGSEQSGAAGSELGEPLVSRVVDANGEGVGGVVVRWEILEGEGSLSSGQVTSDETGHAEVTWTLGTQVLSDPARVQARLADSDAEILFTATIQPGPPARVEDAGNPDRARVGTIQEMVGRVTDDNGNPVPGVEVFWLETVGRVDPGFAISDSEGLVRTQWQLPSLPIEGQLGARFTGSSDLVGLFQLIVTTRRWVQGENILSWSSPAIAGDGTIYYGTRSGQLRAVNPDGSLRWTYIVGGTGETVEEAPSVGPDGRIYVGSYPGTLFHAVNPQGTGAWTYPVTNFVRSTPAIAADGTIYALGLGDSLYALTATGARRWAVPIPESSDDAPVIGGDGTVFVPEASAGRLHAIGPDGVSRWVHTFPGPSVNNDLGTPSIGPDGTIYITARDRNLYALSAEGQVRWAVPVATTLSAAPRAAPAVGSDGTIYVGALDTGIYAITPAGQVKWKTSHFTSGAVFGTPILRADGSIVYVDAAGAMYCVGADGTLLWIDRGMRAGGAGSPAIAPDGTLYLTSGVDGLVAFDGGVPPAQAPWPMYMRDHFHTGRQQ